ncbi:MBL fold metallo-hydrolase [Alteromonas ponticola]|uniref:MBL fold metallo-hydrolase n=1 Tax=Alteromonas aquimaris TaxID=2998417 RepID=A0ABT3PAK5_9ALTE|nr:MBL fold metallo-hydrolase [Alteromonas aquimaris]MCW8109788.1 MBL fold metallo-hydrolase [Alteromonas aquimaris]
MEIQRFKAKGLAQLSYLVSSKNEAFVVDPQLDCEQYLQAAAEQNVTIKFVVETHRNEDFISGAAVLGSQLNIPVYHGQHSDAPIEYAESVKDGDTFDVGELKLTIIETPGHTKDSICIAVADTSISDEVVAIFTGDTLFVNDVGRTDFYPEEKEHITATLYESLQKLNELPGETVVYPAHGAGSVCGGGMADREFSTLGYEKRHNPKWSLASKEQFVKEKLEETHYYAPYFEKMERLNSKGHLDCIVHRDIPALSARDVTEFATQIEQGTLQVIDVRNKDAFCQTHIRGSLFFGAGLTSAYGGWFLDDDTEIVIVAPDANAAKQNAIQLKRMGYEKIQGYVVDLPVRTGDEATDKGLSAIEVITAKEVEHRIAQDRQAWSLLDVRKQDERDTNAIEGSDYIYLGYLPEKFAELDKDRHYTCYCGSGVRATTAASFLAQQGVKDVDVMEGSMKAWKKLKG